MIQVRQYKTSELVFDEEQTKTIFKYFYPTVDLSGIDASSYDAKVLAQNMFVQAVERTDAMGYVHIVFDLLYSPTGKLPDLKAIAKRAMKQWVLISDNTNIRKLEDIKIYDCVRINIASESRNQVDSVNNGQPLPSSNNSAQTLTSISIPLQQIAPEDIHAGINVFDAWLGEISGGAVGLDQLKASARAVRVNGNIMALVGSLIELSRLAQTQSPRAQDWTSLAINLLALIPTPTETAAVRMSLRPTLFLVQQALQDGADTLSHTTLSTLSEHLNETHAGELDTLAEKANV